MSVRRELRKAVAGFRIRLLQKQRRLSRHSSLAGQRMSAWSGMNAWRRICLKARTWRKQSSRSPLRRPRGLCRPRAATIGDLSIDPRVVLAAEKGMMA
jgi:hypothetical protein